jgi:transcriptional regulator with XRE-family HTH domain
VITPEQIKAARKLLGWSMATLARQSGRSLMAIACAELLFGKARGSAITLMFIQITLEAAGIEFLNHGQPGVRLRKAP